MRLLSTLSLAFLLSLSMISIAGAHCGSCGTGDKDEAQKDDHKAHKHDHKAHKHDHKAHKHDHKAHKHDHKAHKHDHKAHKHDHTDAKPCTHQEDKPCDSKKSGTDEKK